MLRTRILVTPESVKSFDVIKKLIVGLETGQIVTTRIVTRKSFFLAERFFLGVNSSVRLKMEPGVEDLFTEAALERSQGRLIYGWENRTTELEKRNKKFWFRFQV